MKKFLLTIFAVALTASAFAIQPITQDGQFNLKKSKGAVAAFAIHWEGTQCGSIDDGVFVKGSVPIDEWLAAQDAAKIEAGKAEDANYVKDWEAIKEESNRYFKEEWNNEFGKKGLSITRNESAAQYRFDIFIDGLDWGNIAGSVFGFGNAGGAIIFGHAEITDIATGAKVVSYKINHVQGSGHVSDRLRIMLVLHELIEEFEDLR